jgi:copper chaperone
MEQTFKVQNVKCGGCAAAIREGLLKLSGVEEVDVTIQEGIVTVRGTKLSREALAGKLAEIGYPETAA